MDKDDWTTGTDGKQFSTADFDLEKTLAAMKQLDLLRRNSLRSMAGVSEITCPTCGRRPIVTNGGFGDEIQMCPHLMESLTLVCGKAKVAEKPAWPHSPVIPIGAIGLVEFDDGPARWGES